MKCALLFASCILIFPIFSFAQESCGSIVSYYDGEEYSELIENCDNPFGIGTANQNLRAYFGETEITDSGSYTFLNEQHTFTVTEAHLNADVVFSVYRHVGADYYEESVSDNTFTFVLPATYTVVVGEYPKPEISSSFLEKFWRTLWRVAHAFPGRTKEFTITVSAPTIGASSVLFLPGIQASRLYKEGILGTEDQVWEPNSNQDVTQLRMTDSGESIEDIYTKEILDEIFGLRNVYNGFEHFLDGLVTDAVVENWKPFAYDWRYSVKDVAENGTKYEGGVRDPVKEIEALAAGSFSGKVTLVGHSNGGLLAKAIMARLTREGKDYLVDRVIFIGSPQLGTPKAIAALLHGYDQSSLLGITIDGKVVRSVTDNMPGALGLTPTRRYFEKNGLTVFFDEKDGTAPFRAAYGNAINDEAELLEFMTGVRDGREANPAALYSADTVNRVLLEEAFNDHDALLDSWVAPSHVEVIEIVGVGLNTLSGIEYREFKKRECVPDPNSLAGNYICKEEKIYKPFPHFTQYGDETVVSSSAEGYEGGKAIYFVDLKLARQLGEQIEHADLLQLSDIQTLVHNVLLNQTSGLELLTIKPETPKFADPSLVVGTHSPVEVVITNKEGKTVEKGNDLYPRENIPGSDYLELGGSSYIIVPKGNDYTIEIKGTGRGGATFTADEIMGSTSESKVSVFVATVTPSTTISVEYTNNVFGNLHIDENGDGVIDTEMTPSGEVIETPATYADLKAAIQKLEIKSALKKVLLIQVEVAEALSKKSIKSPKMKQLELIALHNLEATLKLYVKNRLLVQAQSDPILKIIAKLK